MMVRGNADVKWMALSIIPKVKDIIVRLRISWHQSVVGNN